MPTRGNRVERSRKGYGSSRQASRRGGGKGPWSSKRARQRNEFPRQEEEVRLEAPDVKDEYSVFTFNLKDMGRRPTLDEGKMRAVAVEIGIEIKGNVEATLAHGRLPVNFESTLGASEPVKILEPGDSVVAIALYRGMRESVIEKFRDFPAGDNKVNGRKSKYTKGDRRDIEFLDDKSSPKIRIWATGLGNLQDKQGDYCVVLAFRNEPGARLRVTSMQCSGYVKNKRDQGDVGLFVD